MKEKRINLSSELMCVSLSLVSLQTEHKGSRLALLGGRK